MPRTARAKPLGRARMSLSLFMIGTHSRLAAGDDARLFEHVVRQSGNVRGVIDADGHLGGASKQIRKTPLQKPFEIGELFGPRQALRGPVQELSLAGLVMGGKFGVRLQRFLPRFQIDRGFIFRSQRVQQRNAAANA